MFGWISGSGARVTGTKNDRGWPSAALNRLNNHGYQLSAADAGDEAEVHRLRPARPRDGDVQLRVARRTHER
jgi:hypothetical protein